jgi:hypothetical protein
VGKWKQKFEDERDRRYAEARQADQRALEIKEGEREKALGLARDSQKYRDEQANKLREQINSERGLYATKEDIKPLIEFVASQQGRSTGLASSWGYLLGLLGLLGTFVGIIGTIAAVVVILRR